MNISKSVVFHETLRLRDFLSIVLSRRFAFYNTKSFLLRACEKFLRINVYPHARRISWGDLATGTGIRSRAYEAALADLGRLSQVSVATAFQSMRDTDLDLIFQKYFFDLLYLKHEYYLLVGQYASEHSHERFSLNVDLLPNRVGVCGVTNLKVVCRGSGLEALLKYLGSILVMPVYITYVLTKSRRVQHRKFANTIICEVDQPSTYQMFSELFKGRPDVNYVIQRQYLSYFSAEQRSTLNFSEIGLSEKSKCRIRRYPGEYLQFSIQNFSQVYGLGWLFFDFVKTLVHGSEITADAEECAYLTFEHLTTPKALRNELLRADGNRSIYVCKNLYIVSRYFHSELRYNYDVLCSSGACLESVYAMQEARTSIFLTTGAYDSHHATGKDVGYESRIAPLREYKGRRVAITILSNGIMDETYSGECRLMALARKLAACPGVYVFVRQKPGQPSPKYRNFFSEQSAGFPTIRITHDEFLLSDFLEVTDLFVTSSSGSASDLCPAGAQFYSVDFWADSDQFLWQTLVEGVFIPESAAFDTVVRWIKDDPPSTRLEHRGRMARLSSQIAYQFESFEQYRNNFQALVAPYLPSAMEGEKVQ
jgi:hypothetical protein